MKKSILLSLIILGAINLQVRSQKLYPVTSGEMIFSQSQSSFTQEFIDQYPGANLAANNVRYTVFFHLGQYIHYDFNDNVGLYSGLGIRNVGMITDETLPQTVTTTGADVPYEDYKVIRRQYMLGLPLAFKVGSFDKHFYFFAGGEYEMAFVLKEKYWTGSFDTRWFKDKKCQMVLQPDAHFPAFGFCRCSVPRWHQYQVQILSDRFPGYRLQGEFKLPGGFSL